MNQLKRLNGLRSSRIYAGQRLKVTSGSVSSNKVHKVRRGDTLGKIASKYGTSIRKIQRKNRLRTTKVYIGQRLKI